MNKQWISLARAGQWQDLLRTTEQCLQPEKIIPCTLWRIRALRALERGEEANAVLLRTASSEYRATAAELAEYAEELVQCGYLEPAARIVVSLEGVLRPQADFLWALIWREKEDWLRCNAALEQLASHGGQWVGLATVQKAWSCLLQGDSSSAMQLLASFRNEAHAAILKLRVRVEASRNNIVEAERLLRQVAVMQPLDWEWPCLMAAVRMGGAVQALGKGDHTPIKVVHDLFRKGLLKQPRQAEALYQRARLYLTIKNFDAARDDCNAALNCKPWADAPAMLLVNHLASRREYAKASSVLDSVRRHYDTPLRAGAVLDLMRLDGAKRSDLVATLNPLQEKFGENPLFLRAAGAALQSAKMFDRAANLYAKVLQLTPEDSATRNNLAMLFRDRGDLEEAVDTWRNTVAEGSADDRVLLNFAHVLVQRGDYAEAERFFMQVLDNKPNSPSALRGMAEIHYAAGTDDIAWEYAKRSLELDPANPLAWKTLAGIQRRKSGVLAAISILEQGTGYAQPVLTLHQELFSGWRSVLGNKEIRRRVTGWCEEYPQEKEYYLMLADAAMDANDFEACEAALQHAREIDPGEGGIALIRFYQGRNREGAARRVAEQLVREDPDVQKNWGLYAEVLYQQQRYDTALSVLEKGLKIDPMRFALVRQKVGMLLEQELYDEAVNTAKMLVAKVPLPQQLGLVVEALRRAGRHDECVEVLEDWLSDRPKDQVVLQLYSAALRRAGRHDDALRVLADLNKNTPGNYNVARSYVRALLAVEKHEEALRVIEKLSTLLGERPDIQASISALLREQGELDTARNVLNGAMAKFPDHLDIWCQATLLEKREDNAEAEKSLYEELLKRFHARRWAGFALSDLVRLKMAKPMQDALNKWRREEPDSVDPWWAAYNASHRLGEKDHALEHLDKIESLRGPSAAVYMQKAAIFSERWALSQAISELRKAIELRPKAIAPYRELLGLHAKAGNFDEFDDLMNKLKHLLGDRRYGQYDQFFFNINCHPTWSAEQIFQFYSEWYERAVKPSLPAVKPYVNTVDPDRPLRIGYLSPDFRQHAVAYFSEPLLVEHDRNQFELYAYAHLEPGQDDEYTDRFKTYFHHWTETQSMGTDELERLVRRDKIDILVDLAGHTSNNPLALLMRRPAPLQVSWAFGAGQTTGLRCVDYLVGDEIIIPSDFEQYIAEKPLRLPFSGFPYKPGKGALEPTPLPCLTSETFTLGVLTRPLRTNRNTVRVWAEILKRLPQAKIRFDHIPYVEDDVQQRMREYFSEYGIGTDRLLFVNTRPYWQALSEIDLQLDTFPAGSGTVITDGLWMERLPVTLKSRPIMGRIATAQLSALGLDDLCVAEEEDMYIEKVVTLANDPERLAKASHGLRKVIEKSVLMDYAGYGRAVADMYRRIWVDWCESRQMKRQ